MRMCGIVQENIEICKNGLFGKFCGKNFQERGKDGVGWVAGDETNIVTFLYLSTNKEKI